MEYIFSRSNHTGLAYTDNLFITSMVVSYHALNNAFIAAMARPSPVYLGADSPMK